MFFLPTYQPSCVPMVASGKAERLARKASNLFPNPFPIIGTGLNRVKALTLISLR